MKKSSRQNYILIPASGSEINPRRHSKVADFLSHLTLKSSSAELATINFSVRNMEEIPHESIEMTVLDSIKAKGAKLVNMNSADLANFRFSYPGLRIIPEKFYSLSTVKESIVSKVKMSLSSSTYTIIVRDDLERPVKNVKVIAFTNFADRTGAEGTTNAHGKVKLKLNEDSIEQLFLYPEHSSWGLHRKNITLTEDYLINLKPIDMNHTDALRYFYDTRNWPPVSGKVRVGVVDTGTGPHIHLPVSGGKNLVTGEAATNYKDKDGHGTHVAGIIAAQGGMPGVAAGVEIMAYKVFPHGQRASNFYIMKAIAQAIKDKCDIINLSLGDDELDEGLTSSIKDAYNAGIICFAANGNGGRQPVDYPAAYSLAIAVSALGRKNTFQAEGIQASMVKAPYGSDPNNFLADFSNVGVETDLTAPGVGIISTFPDNKYAVMDGTSMACPAAAGIAARLLAGNSDLLALPRNDIRSNEIVKFLSLHIKSMGFGANFEGKGMLFTNEIHH